MISLLDQILKGTMRDYCYSTGVRELDDLIGCINSGTIVEFFGDLDVLVKLSYRLVAKWSCYGKVALLIAQNSPLLYDFYEVKKRALLDSCVSQIVVSRSFRIEDTIQLLSEATLEVARSYVLFDPFVHVSELTVKDRWKTSNLTRHIRRLSGHGARIVIFNRVSPLSRKAPEGGSLYRHTVHVSLSVTKTSGNGARVFLVKHPSREFLSSLLSLEEIEGRSEWVGQALLLDWL